jgi:hypothetical protein
MALPSGAYVPRDPAASVLYQVLRDHYETFRVEAGRLRDGEGLPRFVAEEFEAFSAAGGSRGDSRASSAYEALVTAVTKAAADGAVAENAF